MRFALCALALAALAPAAAAQTYQAQPGAVFQLQRDPLLNGVWRIGGLGDVTITTRPNGVLDGSLEGRPCHGQYLSNAFALFCEAAGRGPYLISGQAFEVPLENSTARARTQVFGQAARMNGQIHQSYLSSRGHTEEITEFTANRQ